MEAVVQLDKTEGLEEKDRERGRELSEAMAKGAEAG
jgi:hypothetical protein